jgi:uncharacterized membrane protein YoaT (DUF817 family)
MNFFKKLFHFTIQQALCCIFRVALFATLAASNRLFHLDCRKHPYLLGDMEISQSA